MFSNTDARSRGSRHIHLTRKKEMNTLRKTLLTGLAALSLGGAMLGAQAQSQAPAPEHGRKATMTQEERQAKHAEFEAAHAQRIARLHDALKITPSQENAWNAFVASMKPLQHADHQHDDRSAWAGMTAPQRAEKMLAMQKARTAAMEQHVAAMNSFYSVLSPEQKKIFDDKAAHMQHRFGRHGGMHEDMHGGQRGGDAGRG
jgi:Spy/CpxP family protein refolding chaperone